MAMYFTDHCLTLAAHDQMRITLRVSLDESFKATRYWIDELNADRSAILNTYEFNNVKDGLDKFRLLVAKELH